MYRTLVYLVLMKILKILSISVFLIAFVLLSTKTHALDGDMNGKALSATVGDINLSGVNFLLSAPGTGSGRATNTVIGDISFNNSEVSSSYYDPVSNTTIGCPTMGPNCGPYIDWQGDGSGLMRGYARACSVFVSGCSGALKSDTARGGWDGFINLNGVTVEAVTGKVSGMAWGSEVIGWVDFSGGNGSTYISIPPPPVNVPPNVDAGSDQNIGTASFASLSGSASDPDGSISSTIWTIISNPGSASIGSPSSLATSITGLSTAGVYTFRLTATDDDGATNYDEVNIAVQPIPTCQVGEEWNGSACVPIPPPPGGCPFGQAWIAGACVTTTGSCPSGQTWNGTSCVPTTSVCAAPLVPDAGGNCIPCPSGKVYDFATASCVDKKKPIIKEF